MNYILYKDSPYLEHHGVLGMKWGIRRYQNKDGSLTSAGKKRYGVDGYKSIKQYQNRLNDLDTATSMINRRISANKNRTRQLQERKEKTDAYISLDGGNIFEKARSKALAKTLERREKSDVIDKLIAKRDEGYVEMASIIEKLQDSGFKVSTKPTIRNVNTGADYVLAALSGAAAITAGPIMASTFPISAGFGMIPGFQAELSKIVGGVFTASVLNSDVAALTLPGKLISGTKYKVE